LIARAGSRAGASWRKTLRTQRREISKHSKQSPSLRDQMPALIREAYGDVVQDAVDETGLAAERFPSVCPYAPDAVPDEDNLPDASFRGAIDGRMDRRD
jgi:hypothetical protein